MHSEGDGGGASGSTLYNCTLTGNSDGYGYGYGGGAMSSTLYNCTLTGNSAYVCGGAMSSTLYNCTVTENASGGASGSTLYNCTVTGNEGGGVGDYYWFGAGSTLYNSIVYYNFGGNYAEGTTLSYCCTTPLPAGPGNIEADPQLVSASHLSLASPCVGAGNATYASGLDIDGEIWANPPCMGADQLTIGSATGALTMQVEILYTNFAAGYAIPFVAQNTGRILASVWDFGDGTLVTNQAFVSHAWTAPGVYTVRLTGYNDSFPAGVTSTVQVEVVGAVHYVNAVNLNPVFPYASWATAATNIQDAVTASTVPGRLVLVTNGVYRTGSVEANGPNRVALTNTLLLRSVNGPDVTTIEGASGDQPVRCAYVGNRAVLSGFTLTRGKADAGGGACSEASGVVTNCALTGNSAGGGGGASGGTLYNCTLTGNSAIGDYGSGGGASGSTLYNCTLMDNSAYGGGAAVSSTLYNCTLTGNTASSWGGGAGSSTLYNCTLTGNSAGRDGGGAYYCTFYNCIVYYNQAPSGANYGSASFKYSCTTPLPEGHGNIDAYPQLTWDMHIQPTSPCVGAGNAAYATGRDMDGELWANPPSMGADQFVPGPITGELTLQIYSDYSQVACGYPMMFVAQTSGRIVGLVWDFGDGTMVTNRAFVTHAWDTPGVYTVRLTGCNDSYPERVATTTQVEVIDAVHYVNVANLNPVFPYASWQTAATKIQDAVGAGTVVGRLILVTNGVYQTGSVEVVEVNGGNRVALTNAVVLRSVNGAQATIIDGGGQVRCVYLAANAIVSGFTLRNGHGVYRYWWVGGGGGASGGTLYDCTLIGNSTPPLGGGASGSTLYNCTLTGNSADLGGGAYSSILYNCIVYSNQASTGPNHYGSGLAYSCTTPLPDGLGNIAADPRFVNAAAGDFRLRPDSPCINAGNNSYVSSATDFGGYPRIVSGTVDIGAYEYQGVGSTISYAWLQQYGLPTDGSADFAHGDADGMNNWQEWRCGTCPTNSLSALRLLTAAPAGTNVTVNWQSVAGVSYFLERSTNLWASPPFTLLAPDLPGQPGTTSFTDTSAFGTGPFFYRVGVGN